MTAQENELNIQATVVLLTKNPGNIFKEVLPAVLNQKAPWKFEVLIIDSGSTDGTLEFIELHRDVRLVRIASEDFGHGRTRNLAMTTAKGKYVAMLTHDAKPSTEAWLTNLVAPFDLDASVAGVFGRHIAYPTATPYIKRDLDLHFNNFLQWPLIMGIEDPDRYANDQGYRQVLHFFSDNNACLRKTVWEKLPYPDVDFAEDQLWAKSVIEAGYKRAYQPDAVVYHSHDYNVWNTFRRSFDEARALKKLFGYELCKRFAHCCYQTYACALRDLIFLSRNSMLRTHKKLALVTPFLHAAKQVGFYLGGHQGVFSNIFFSMFSLDNSKKKA
jgi:rhamnosyltransferase